MGAINNKIKTRIKTVESALKVTSAMRLVSSVKLKKYKTLALNNAMFSNELTLLLKKISSFKCNSPFLKENDAKDKNLLIIVTSSLGLCGSYNSNIFKLASSSIKKDDDLIIFGKKGINRFQSLENKIIRSYESSIFQDEKMIKDLTYFVKNSYLNNVYKSVRIIYTKYINSLNFKAVESIILPLDNKESESCDFPPLFEPSFEEVSNALVNYYLDNILSVKICESEICEYASRQNAMDNATENAKEILNDLTIQFNKARQASITQEIIEIVAGTTNM